MRKILFIIPFFLWTCGGGVSDDLTDIGSSNIISQTHYIEVYKEKTFDLIAIKSKVFSLYTSI